MSKDTLTEKRLLAKIQSIEDAIEITRPRAYLHLSRTLRARELRRMTRQYANLMLAIGKLADFYDVR